MDHNSNNSSDDNQSTDFNSQKLKLLLEINERLECVDKRLSEMTEQMHAQIENLAHTQDVLNRPFNVHAQNYPRHVLRASSVTETYRGTAHEPNWMKPVICAQTPLNKPRYMG